MIALHDNRTWETIPLSYRKFVVGYLWVFTVKYLSNGTAESYKPCLVAKDYTQIYGIDYAEVFSPVATVGFVRIFSSLVANLGWPLYQLDVKNAFLHIDLEEEVYMEQPLGFVAQGRVVWYVSFKRCYMGLSSPRERVSRSSMM